MVSHRRVDVFILHDPSWYLWKRRKTTISRGAWDTILSLSLSLLSLCHPLFSFFSRFGVFFLQKAAHFDLEEKKKKKGERSRCQWTKRLETLPTLCFKAIYTLIERRSARGTKRYHPISECTQLRMVARVCYSVIK